MKISMIQEFQHDLSDALSAYRFMIDDGVTDESEGVQEAYDRIKNCNNRKELLSTLLTLGIDYKNLPSQRSVRFWSELALEYGIQD